VSNPYSPNIVLTRFRANGQKKDSLYKTHNVFNYEVPPDLNSITLRFAALSYAAPEKNIYQVKLEGFDQNWINLNNENEITYSQLQPGNYQFKVRATNNSGLWSKKQLNIEFTVLPHWYQTWWFLMFIALLTAAIIYFLYIYRIRQLLKVAAMRQKISSDLHDDIGATLSSNKIYTKLAKESPDKNKYLDLIENNVNTVIKSLDEMVWSINPKNDTAWALREHIESYACPILAASNINCHFISNLKDADLTITPKQRRHLFLSTKEMINNVTKHSNAKNCYINFSKVSRYLYIEVKDDGMGFNKEQANITRNGLHSLSFRAKDVGGRFSVESEEGKGTTVRMIIKL
jgi:nitrate/nitrite-specific signal transduction histidine kinase